MRNLNSDNFNFSTKYFHCNYFCHQFRVLILVVCLVYKCLFGCKCFGSLQKLDNSTEKPWMKLPNCDFLQMKSLKSVFLNHLQEPELINVHVHSSVALLIRGKCPTFVVNQF